MSEDCQGVRGENKIPEKRPRLLRIEGEFDEDFKEKNGVTLLYSMGMLSYEERLAGWEMRQHIINGNKPIYILRTPEFANELWCLEEMKKKILVITKENDWCISLFNEDDIERTRILKSKNYGKIALEVIHEGPEITVIKH